MEIAKIFINGLIGTIYNNDGTIKQKGVELIDIVREVQGYPFASEFEVYINSEGGVVETGFEIYYYLRSLGKPITTIGVSQVASIATVIFMAGDSRKLKKGTDFLIHLPMIGLEGYHNSTELESIQRDIQVVEKQLIDFYKKTTNLTEEAILPLLKKETILNAEMAFDLRFATEYDLEFEAVAYLKDKNSINLNTDKQMTENEKSWFEKILNTALLNVGLKSPKKGFTIVSLKKGAIVNLDVTDANGVIITFPDVAEGSMPQVGDMATIDGNPAEGEYLMPDGSTYVFVAGSLTQIVDATEVEVDLKTENENLKAQLEAQKEAFTNELVNIKRQVTSKFKEPEKNEKPKEEGLRENTKRNLFKN